MAITRSSRAITSTSRIEAAHLCGRLRLAAALPGSVVLSIWNGTPAVAGWLGNFDASRTPVLAEFDWVAFTRAGETCRFPESITCHPL